MSKTIHIPGGTITLAESKAICPHCQTHIDFDKIEKRFWKQSKSFIRMKCDCGKYVGITSDYKGDFVAYKLGE